VNDFIEEIKITPKLKLTTDSNYLDICEYLQRELQKIGIEIKVEVLPTASLRQAKSSGKLELFRASWIADYPDAENYLSLFNSLNFSPKGPNYTHFSNPKFDKLYQESLNLVSDSLRIKKYEEMNYVERLLYKKEKGFLLSDWELRQMDDLYKEMLFDTAVYE
jgi:peptide/nickel transport system substrate-binding protein